MMRRRTRRMTTRRAMKRIGSNLGTLVIGVIAVVMAGMYS